MLSDMEFKGSQEPTVGVEVELQILDPQSGDLAPGAVRILDACREEGVEGVSGEFLLCMLEVKTDVCADVNEVKESLFPRLRRVRNIATSLGYELAMGGTHPFANPLMASIFPDERYQRMQFKQGWAAYQEAVFGLHVHVGVPDGNAAIGVINQSVEYLPHMLALAANSPFWQGVDANCASSRLRMFRPSGSAGLPGHFADWSAFCHYCEVMRQAGLMESTKDMYWDIRPQPSYGTVEFRIFDVPADLSTVLGLTALARNLVVESLERLRSDPKLSQGDQIAFWLANENRWLATRFGLHMPCVRRPGCPREALADDTRELIERLLPLAKESGEAEFLRRIMPGYVEAGADRKRRIYREHGNWQPIIEEMKERWVHELDHSSPATFPIAG